MKLTLENPSRMVLSDHNYLGFAFGVVFCIIGLAFISPLLIALLFGIAGGISHPESLVGAMIIAVVIGIVPAGAGALFVFCGYLVLSRIRMMTITLDKSAGKGSCAWRGMTVNEKTDFYLRDIKKVTLNLSGALPASHINNIYVLNIVPKSGDSFAIRLGTSGIRGIFGPPNEKEKATAQKIADFLGVPMEFGGAPYTDEILSGK